ncbi:MAG: hypothetical protein ACE5EO_11725 [Candidatus Krumholzibacteriia bacterium]
MNRKRLDIPVWVAVLVLVPGFLFAFPGDPTLSQPAHDQPGAVAPADNASMFEGPNRSAPRIVQYFEAHSITSGVELAWSAISEKDIRGFSIYRRGPDGFQFLLVNDEGLIGPWRKSYVDGDVEPATTYQYALGVVHTDGSEALSPPAEVTTRNTRPRKRSLVADATP